MKKNLSKIVVATLVLVAIAGTMIFAGLVNKLPNQFDEVVRYTLIEDVAVHAYIFNDRKTELDETEYDFDTEEYKTVIFGDANKDGKINVMDAVLMVNKIVKGVELTAVEKATFNVANSNDKADVKDVMQLVKFAVGNADTILEKELAKDELKVLNVTSGTVDGDEVVDAVVDVKFNVKTPFVGLILAENKEIDPDRLEFKCNDDPIINMEELDEDNYGKHMTRFVVSDEYLPKGTYEIEAFAYGDPDEEVLLSIPFNYNPITLGGITLTNSDDEVIGDVLDSEDEVITVKAPVNEGHNGTFTLEFISKDGEDTEAEIIDTLKVTPGTVNGTDVVFEDVDITDLLDGYVTVKVTYTEGKYVESSERTDIRKATKIITVSENEIDRKNYEANGETPAFVGIHLTTKLAEVLEDDVVSAKAIVKGYTDEDGVATKPTVTASNLIGADLAELGNDTYGIMVRVPDEGDTAALYAQLNATETNYKKLPCILFVEFTTRAGTTEILEFAVPANLEKRVPEVPQATLTEKGVVTWLEPIAKEGIVGYRVFVIDEDDTVYTEKVAAGTTTLNLLAEMRELGEGEYTVGIVALGNGTTHLDSQDPKEAEGTTTISTIATIPEVTFDEENSTKILATFHIDNMEDEDEIEALEEAIATIDHLDLYIDNAEVEDEEDVEPQEVAVVLAEPVKVEDEDEEGEGDIVYTIDLAKYMEEVGTYTVVFDVVAKEDSVYLDSLYEDLEAETQPTQTVDKAYAKAEIEKVTVETYEDVAYVSVKVNGEAGRKVKFAYKTSTIDETITTLYDVYETITPEVGESFEDIKENRIEDLEINAEYTLVVTLFDEEGKIELDTLTTTMKADGKNILTTSAELTKGNNFKVNYNKAGEVTSILFVDLENPISSEELKEYSNVDEILEIYEMLNDGDRIILSPDGKVMIIYLDKSDDPEVEDETTRTITLDKSLLCDSEGMLPEVELRVNSSIELLVLKGTATCLNITSEFGEPVIDIEDFKADKYIASYYFDDEIDQLVQGRLFIRFGGDFDRNSLTYSEFFAQEFETTSITERGTYTIKDFAQKIYIEQPTEVRYNAEMNMAIIGNLFYI